MVDINKSTFAKGLGRPISEIPSSLVRETNAFRRGLITFNASGELVNSITRLPYKTLQEAIDETTRSGISELSVFTGSTGPLSLEPQGYAPLSDMTRNLNEMLRSDNIDTREFRSRHKILKDLEGKNIELVRIGYSDTDGQTAESISNFFNDKISYPDKSAIELFQDFQKEKILPPGYLSTRDGSATLLRLRYQTAEGYKYLTGEETGSLFSTLDAQFINVEKLTKGIADLDDLGADPNSAIAKLGSTMGKMTKRESQSLTHRNTTIDQMEVGNIVKRLSKKVDPEFRLAAPKTLEESFLFFDPTLETTLKAFSLETSYSNTLLGDPTLTKAQRQGILRQRKATEYVMSGQTTEASQQIFREMLDLQGLSSDQDFDDFAKVIQSQFRETAADKRNQKISLQDIISRIEKTAGEEGIDPVLKGKYKSYVRALGELKKIDDGSGFITGVPFRQHAEQLKASIKEAQGMLPSYAQGSEEALTLTSNISSFRSQLDRIVTNSSEFLESGDRAIKPALREFEHTTARVFLGKKQAKSVFDLITGEVEDDLARLGYMGAGSTELLKTEGGFGAMSFPGSQTLGSTAGEQITLQVNTGRGMDRVYSEPQAMIFHRQQYGKDFYDQVGESADMVRAEIKNLENNIISERLRRSILNDATLDIDGFDADELIRRFGSRQQAENVKSTARTLQAYLASGNVRVNQIPELANGLIKVLMRDAFRTKGTYRKISQGTANDMPVYNYAMPYAQRQAIDTEGRISRGGSRVVLGSTRQGTELSARSNIQTEFGDLSLFKFRHVGHKMIIPDTAASSFGLYEAGGGFDLDDKFITNLQFVRNSQGVRQLTAFAWRQPTGPQEFALMAPYLDDDTLMRMFGDENQMGQRFRALTEGVSEFINTNSDYNLSSDLKKQLNVLELEKLSKEQKIFKYLNALSHGQESIAQQYKKSAGDVTQEDLQRAIFKLVDLNGNEKFTLDGLNGTASIGTDDFANRFLNAGGLGVKGAKNKYLNISQTSEDIIRKASMTKAGTMAALNADEIMKLPGELQSAYRQSNLTQIIQTSSSPAEDLIFQSNIRDLYGIERNLTDFDDYMNETTSGLSKMEKSIRVASHVYRSSESEAEKIGVRSAFTGMTQRLNMSALASPKGELGTYVNRLGWAVSSEEQRLAILDNAINYANETGNKALLEMAERLKLSTSLVYNPEGAIDPAVAVKMKINLTATTRDLFTSATLTREAGMYSDEAIESSISRALFSLIQEDDTAQLTALARKAGITVTLDNVEDVVKQIFNRNDEITQELISLINVTSDNVGRALVANTARSIGAIRAMQEMFPELQTGTGLMGIDEYVSGLKLSSKVDDAAVGDINTVVNSILAGIDEVQRATDMSLPADSKLRGLEAALVPEKIKGRARISGDEAKARLLKIIGLEGEAKKIYGIPDFEAILAPLMREKDIFQNALKRQSFNEYVPFKALADQFGQSKTLNEAMKTLQASIKMNLESTEGLFGTSIDDLVKQKYALDRIKRIAFDSFTLNKDNLGNDLVNAGLLGQGELNNLLGANDSALREQTRQRIIQNIEESRKFAAVEIEKTLKNFFDNNDPTLNSVDEVMDKLLFDVAEMKNADKGLGTKNPTLDQRTRATIGSILDDILKSENPIEITLPTSQTINLKELSGFVRNRMQQLINKPFKEIEEEMIALIEAARNKSSDPGMLAQENLMDKEFLKSLFETDTPGAFNVETGGLERIPSLVNAEEVQDILQLDGKIDMQFLEDFMAYGEDSNQASALITQRIRAAASATATEEEISSKIFERINLVSSVRSSYEADRLSTTERMIAIREALENAEVERVGTGTTKLSDLVDKLLSDFGREADDEARAALDRAIADSYSGSPPVSPGKYTRIQDFIKSPQMREMYQGALRNKGKIAGVAALATGLAVFGSINKKERTQEAMSGPPLLPGGNPYERIPTQQMQIPDAPIASGNQGMSYNISVDGDQDKMEEFMNRARISNKWKYPRYYA